MAPENLVDQNLVRFPKEFSVYFFVRGESKQKEEENCKLFGCGYTYNYVEPLDRRYPALQVGARAIYLKIKSNIHIDIWI